MVDILVDIDRYCRDNGLMYHLAYGSLLGAVRHHGFIPWDDDIDIWMPRPDFEYFRDVVSKLALVTIASCVIPSILRFTMPAGWIRAIIVCCVSVILTAFSVLFLGCDRGERKFILGWTKSFLSKFKSR